MEVAVATLATDRALLLLGVPGTAKTWVGEHLAAAISGDSSLLVQGTAGTGEESIRYGWNYASLLANGPSRAAVVPSPVMRAMETGALVRIEELTRIPADVQDALITILSEKTLPMPELDTEVQARKGFNVIATANDRDRGINELSSALKRRFNTVILPLPATLEIEVEIVASRVAQLGRALEFPTEAPALEEVRRVVTIFRELRSGADDRRQGQGQDALRRPLDGRGDRRRQPGPRRWRPTSGTAGLGPATLRRAWSAPSCAIRSPTASSGTNTSRPSSRSAKAGTTCTTPVASSPATVRWRASRCSASAITARAPRGACATRLTRSSPDLLLVEGPPEASPLIRHVEDPEMRPPVAILAYDPANAGRLDVLSVRRLLAGMAGDAVRPRARGRSPVRRPAARPDARREPWQAERRTTTSPRSTTASRRRACRTRAPGHPGHAVRRSPPRGTPSGVSARRSARTASAGGTA